MSQAAGIKHCSLRGEILPLIGPITQPVPVIGCDRSEPDRVKK